MARFTKHNNPKKKKVRRRMSDAERELIKAETYTSLGYGWHTDSNGKVVLGKR